MSVPGPRRGRTVAIALLTLGFVVASTVAVVEYVQLQATEERVEELEAGAGTEEGAAPLGDLGQVLEDAFGEAGGALDLFGCLTPGGGVTGAPLETGGNIDQQVDAIGERVEAIRELEFTRPVDPQFLSAQESSARIRQLFLEDYTAEAADREARVLTALGAIPPGTDLRTLRADALGQQVAGFYDPETGELVVRTAGEDLAPLDKVTLSHELEHALADQRLELPLPDEPRPGREDRDLAALAVVEGDATLTMQRFSTTLPLDEQLGLVDPEAIAASEAGLAELPSYLEQELLFPYERGLMFVCDRYAAGGWGAVNAAYDDPPAASVQILFPELYADGFEPVDPRDPGTLSRPWLPVGPMELGAAPLMWLFGAPGGDPGRSAPDPLDRVAAWAGGELRLWTRGEDSAVGIVLAQRTGQPDLCRSVGEWYRAAFEGDRETATSGGGLRADGARQDAVLVCPGEEVRMGIAPNLATATALTH